MTFDKWWMDYKANQRPAPMLTNVGAQYTYLDIRDAAKEAYHARNKPDTTALKDEIKSHTAQPRTSYHYLGAAISQY